MTATYMEAADTRVGPSELEFETPFALEYHLYNSNGVRKVVKIEHATGKVLQNSSSVIPMRWYVKDYQLPWWVLQPVVANVDLDRLLTMDDVEKGR